MFDYTVACPNHKTIFLNLEILFDNRLTCNVPITRLFMFDYNFSKYGNYV